MSGNQEEICIHVEPRTDDSLEDDVGNGEDFRFDIAPFRQTFFRYSMYGLSEVVRSSAFVYASHHSSANAWLDIKKLSVALVGNNEIPNLALFSPTVKEVYFMGHISFPTTAFRLLPQLSCVEKVAFNLGFGGHINEFNESPEEFVTFTPEVQTVTSLEVKINHQLYRACTEAMRYTFNRIINSVLKHSSESFPNLTNLAIDIPSSDIFYDRVVTLNEMQNLRGLFDVQMSEDKVIKFACLLSKKFLILGLHPD